MEIITGYTGKPHVTAEQDRDVNEGIFDTGSFVLKTGSQLATELVSNNEIKVRDGVLVIQGCTAVIKKNTYDPVTIANGSQGMKRIDLIVARYNKNEETKIEEVMLKVIQGTPNASTAAVPTYKTGDAVSLYPVVVTSVTPRPYSSLVFAGDTIIKGASLNATGKPTAALEAKYQLYQLVARLVFQVYLLHITMSPLEYFV